MKLILALLLGYLIGSVNPSILYSKLRGDDIRRHGSGNAGATNTLRTYGKAAAAVVFLFDLCKGILAVLLARMLFEAPGAQYAAAIGAMLGHSFPVYFGFRGGKGVATGFAVLLLLDWRVALIALAVFVVVVVLSRYVSLGSICAAVSAPIAAFALYGVSGIAWFSLALAVLVTVRHASNIQNLLRGTEHKLGEKKEGKA